MMITRLKSKTFKSIKYYFLLVLIISAFDLSGQTINRRVSFKDNPQFFLELLQNGPIYSEPRIQRGEFETWQDFEKRKESETRNAKETYQQKLIEFKSKTGQYYYSDIPITNSLSSLKYNIDSFRFYPEIFSPVFESPRPTNKYGHKIGGSVVSSYLESEFENLRLFESISNIIRIYITIILSPAEAEKLKKSYIQYEPLTVDLEIQRSFVEGNPFSTIKVFGCVLRNKSGEIIYDLSTDVRKTETYANENKDWYTLLHGDGLGRVGTYNKSTMDGRILRISKKNGEIVEGRYRNDKKSKSSVTLMGTDLRNTGYSLIEVFFTDIQQVESKFPGERSWRSQ